MIGRCFLEKILPNAIKNHPNGEILPNLVTLELTQLEHLSDASLLGKLLALPANVILDWKAITRNKHSSLFGLFVSDKE